MSSLQRARAALLAFLLTAGTVVAVPATASATPEQCAGGANGFVDIPDDLSGAIGDQVNTTTTQTYLMFGQVQGRNRGWAKLSAAHGIQLGDNLVWMDWSINGGQTWMQCGPFRSRIGSYSITTPAKDTNAQYWFRAGSLVNGQLVLTDWI